MPTIPPIDKMPENIGTVKEASSQLALYRGMNTMLTQMEERFVSNASVVRRSDFYSGLGKDTYKGARKLYQALGYPVTLSSQDYINRYERGDIAKRLNDLMPSECFKGGVTVSDNEDPAMDSPFEKEVKTLAKKFQLWTVLKRLDKLVGLGQYAVLFLGFSDVTVSEDLKEEVKPGSKLLYIQPYSELSAQISKWETNVASARFRMPSYYRISSSSNSNTDDSINVEVHHTRIIHALEDNLESNVYGTPRLKIVYNILCDIDKIRGGSGEMFWRGARPGFVAKLDEDAKQFDQTVDELREELDNYEHNLRRIMRLSGISLEPIQIQVSDPTPHWVLQLEAICIAKGIPKRILLGSERGELASSQDERAWKEKVEERRNDYVEPILIRAFFDRLIAYKAIIAPAQEDYDVIFKDLGELDATKQSEVAKNNAEAISKYAASPMTAGLVPPQMFLTKIMGWSEDEATYAAELVVGDLIDETIPEVDAMVVPDV